MTGLARVALLAALAVSGGPPPVVRIAEPADGATLPGPKVRVLLEIEGAEIAAVAEGREGTAHHHLFLDADITPAGEPIPVGRPGIVHLGGGQTEYTFDSVAAGRHRLIAVLGDLRHVPWDPAVVDTVFVTVAP